VKRPRSGGVEAAARVPAGAGERQRRGGVPLGQGRSPRRLAIEAVAATDLGAKANPVLARLLGEAGLDDRDKAFVTELVYGTVRMKRACDWLVGQFAEGRLEPVVAAAARVGAYQLAFMRVPAYAATSATVAEVPRRARPVLNAVLRRVAELVEAGEPPWPDLATKLSYPDWLVERLSEDLGPDRALAALEQMNQAAPLYVREDGYAQGRASQAVAQAMAELLRDGPPGPVLDACAAPGGKASLIAPHVPLVAAAEVVPERVKLLSAHVRSLGLENVAAVLADSTLPPFRQGSFAGVLVDAPCSGLGVLHRRPDARWRVRPGDVSRMSALQRRLLEVAAGLVAPGGLLVYSVCTLSLAETEEVDLWLSNRLRGWSACSVQRPPWEPLGRGARLLPQPSGEDGMFLLALRRDR
jgi:16S rRNA (cytosine967-C5)-methyltransferase